LGDGIGGISTAGENTALLAILSPPMLPIDERFSLGAIDAAPNHSDQPECDVILFSMPGVIGLSGCMSGLRASGGIGGSGGKAMSGGRDGVF